MLYTYGLAYEVHRRPFQTDDLASAQSVVGSYHDDDMQRIVLCAVDKLLDFFSVIVAADKLHRLRSVSLIDRISRKDTPFHSRLECKLQERMMSLTNSTFQIFAPEISIVFVYFIACYLLDL